MIQQIFQYVTASAIITLQQLLVVLGPVLAFALVLNYLSKFIRNRAAGIAGVNAYTYFTAPGVMVHETGHAFFCVIFAHRIVRMRMFSPQADGSLGSVEHSFNPKSTYQKIGNFFIGTGPIWFGTAIVCLLIWLLLGNAVTSAASHLHTADAGVNMAAILPQIGTSIWQLFLALANPALFSSWQFWVVVYLIFCIGSHITLSPPDIHGAAQGFVSLVAFLFVFNLLTTWVNGNFTLRAGEWLIAASVIFFAGGLFVICLNLVLAIAVAVVASLLGRG